MSMTSAQFLELQYNSLRAEIETAKANMLKFIVGGSAIVPSAQYLADTFSIGAITLALPLIIVVLVLLFLSENHSMMRAGAYILKEIEPRFPDVVGWETWLSSAEGKKNSTRTVDKLVVIAFSIVASSYFLASVVLAGRYANQAFGEKGQYAFTALYVVIGISLSVVLYSNAQTDTESSS